MGNELKKTPATVSDSYNIPLYQRLFEWDDIKIKQLLNDLYANKDTNDAYYIGMLTAYKAPSSNVYDLVDGQQRITVTTLIGIVFKDYFNEWEKFLCVDDKPRIQFAAREEDYHYICHMILGTKCKEEEINKKMHAGIQCIKDWVEEKIPKTNLRTSFARYVYERMTFFIATLPETYSYKDLNRYFESMNSFGKNLESYEILKVDFLRGLGSTNGIDKAFYTEVWNTVSQMDKVIIRKRRIDNDKETEKELDGRFYDIVSKVCKVTNLEDLSKLIVNNINDFHGFKSGNDINKTTIGNIKPSNEKPNSSFHYGSHHSMLTFSEFLLQVLYAQLGQPDVTINDFFDVHKLLDTFNKYTSNWNPKDFRKYFFNLLKYRVLYDYYFIRVPNNETDEYKLIMRVGDDDDESKDKKILLKFQSLMYAGSASTTFYRWIAPMWTKIDEITKVRKCQANELYIHLVELDQKIENHQFTKETKLRYNENVDFYWFRRLDFLLWRRVIIEEQPLEIAETLPLNAVELIRLSKFRRGGRSVEHLHPRNEDNCVEKWTKYDLENCEDSERQVHRFGNLALIASVFNNEQSNDSLEEKFGRIERQINSHQIQSIKMYLMYLKSKSHNTNWKFDDMVIHEAEMLKILATPLK